MEAMLTIGLIVLFFTSIFILWLYAKEIEGKDELIIKLDSKLYEARNKLAICENKLNLAIKENTNEPSA